MHVRRRLGTHIRGAETYFSLVVGQVPEAERLYAALAVPALIDPALNVPAGVVVAAPRSAGGPVCGVRLPCAHGEGRQSIRKLVAIPLRPEQLRQLVPRKAAFCRAAIAARLCMRWDVDARI
jgi:cytochrome P450